MPSFYIHTVGGARMIKLWRAVPAKAQSMTYYSGRSDYGIHMTSFQLGRLSPNIAQGCLPGSARRHASSNHFALCPGLGFWSVDSRMQEDDQRGCRMATHGYVSKIQILRER